MQTFQGPTGYEPVAQPIRLQIDWVMKPKSHCPHKKILLPHVNCVKAVVRYHVGVEPAVTCVVEILDKNTEKGIAYTMQELDLDPQISGKYYQT